LIQIISTSKSWIEGDAVQQLEKISQLENVLQVSALPDLHGGLVGVAVCTEGKIYPHIVGNDMGCGMSFWQLDGSVKKFKLDRIFRKLENSEILEGQYPEGSDALLREIFDSVQIEDFYSLESVLGDIFANSLESIGTIGRGNHFAEFQKVKEIKSYRESQMLGLKKEGVYFLIHSGSRSVGTAVLQEQSEHQHKGLELNSEAAQKYLKKHKAALKWARVNRKLIAFRFLKALGTQGHQLLDVVHNSVTLESLKLGAGKSSESAPLLIHRKGVNPSNQGYVMVAGSRGSLSYLVKPLRSEVKDVLSSLSLAHGAGRKHRRSEMQKRLRAKGITRKDLQRNPFGGRVLCEDTALLFQEAPNAYKNINQVISDMESFDLIEVVASFEPLITYKTKE
jgi:release factor H-coupled RctB family protein